MSGNRPQILQALVEADEPEAIPLLMDCLASRHQGTVRFAALSIGKLARNKQDICNIAVPQLVDSLSSDDPLTRRTVLNTLLLLNIPLCYSGAITTVERGDTRQYNQQAGCQTIPAVFTTGEPAELSIVENLLRENLTAIEEAEAIEKLRTLHDYELSDLTTVLGKSPSTLSEILSLNKLPADVKDDCRNDPKAGRSILTLIARQTTPEKMSALYFKYKESGLTVGEIRKKTVKPKLSVASVDLGFVDQFYERIFLLDCATLTNDQKEALNLTIVKMRSMLLEKTHKLKVPVTVTA